MSHLILPIFDPLIPQVADMLLEAHPGTRDLSDTACVFPGKRPALYLRRELARRIGGAFHPPAIFDVDGFMSFLARMTDAGRGRREVGLVTRLFHVFAAARKTGNTDLSERLEDFFFWGTRLLDLFDEFGTELVETATIKRAVEIALKEAGLSPEAKGIWQVLPELFSVLQGRLEDERIATRGEDYRIAAQAADYLKLPFSQCILAGFTALTRAEERVFAALARRGIARMVIHEDRTNGFEPRPDLFHLDFQARLARAIPGAWERTSNSFVSPSTLPHIEIFRAPDLHAELDLARRAVIETPSLDPTEMAIVLPDPGALVPVLTWLVEGLGAPFNVSMGYPLDRTPAAGLLIKAIDAVESREGGDYHVPDYLAFLKHPLVMSLGPKDAQEADSFRRLVHAVSNACAERRLLYVDPAGIEAILKACGDFSPATIGLLTEIHERGLAAIVAAQDVRQFAEALLGLLSWVVESGPAVNHPFGSEALVVIIRILNETAASPLGPEPMTAAGFRRLLAYLFRSTPIPFRGSPLSGIQVLGFLETRSLKFRHVFVLDASEGVLPGPKEPDPILPDGIRRALGLPSRESATWIVRHHFRALIAGAETVHIFSSEKDDSEPSRFIQELVWEEEKRKGVIDALPVRRLTERYHVPLPQARPRQKTNQVLSFLRGFTFSPHALDTYLACPFRFHARYVLGIEEPRSAIRAEIDPIVTGEIVHAALERFYRPFLCKIIKQMASLEEEIETACDQAIEERFADPTMWSGPVRLFREILLYRLRNFVKADLKKAHGRRLVALEQETKARILLSDGASIGISGRIDRVEIDPDGTLWIIDYKTGMPEKPPTLQERVVNGRAGIRKTLGSLQLPVYLLLWQERRDVKFSAMNAVIYPLRGVGRKDDRQDKEIFRPLIPADIPWKEAVDGIFMPAVRSIIEEILDPETPFAEDPSDPDTCRHCPYSLGPCRAAG